MLALTETNVFHCEGELEFNAFKDAVSSIASSVYKRYPAFWGSDEQRQLDRELEPSFGAVSSDLAALYHYYRSIKRKEEDGYLIAHMDLINYAGVLNYTVSTWSAILYCLLVLLPMYSKRNGHPPVGLSLFFRDYLQDGDYDATKEY